MSERFSEMSDEALGRALASELRRHAAPAHLRAAITGAPAVDGVRSWWLAPALAATATALLLGLAFVPLLPRSVAVDPALRLTRVVVAEHTRAAMWGARKPAEIVPAAQPWLTQETGIGLASVFGGDDRLSLLSAEPVYLDQRRGLALHYRDEDGHHVTYVALPAPGLLLPERQRQKVERWRPALINDGGFSAWVWKQGDLACFLVSDMVSETDLANFKDYFVRVRAATEPIPAY